MTELPATSEGDALLGKTIGERYVVEGLLGEGGIGRVYRAKHTGLGRAVALKVLLTEHEGSEALRERFRREAQALAALSHPNIVSVTDFGVDGDMLYLVMELLDGCSLSELLKEEVLAPERAIAIVRQVLLALGYAHAANVVHRDLKPQNIFVRKLGDGTDHVTVLDFGLARFVGREDPKQLTRVGMLIGTPAYMAPEQASGDTTAIGARTDVYAAGLLLFEVLCGRRPFLGNEPSKLMRGHLLEDPPRLCDADPSLRASAELEALVARALAKRPEDRFADASAMLAALDAIDKSAIRREGVRARAEPSVEAATRAASPAARAKTPHVEAISSAAVAPRGLPFVPLAIVAGVCLLCGAFGLVGVGWSLGSDDDPEEQAAEPRPVEDTLGQRVEDPGAPAGDPYEAELEDHHRRWQRIADRVNEGDDDRARDELEELLERYPDDDQARDLLDDLDHPGQGHGRGRGKHRGRER